MSWTNREVDVGKATTDQQINTGKRGAPSTPGQLR